MSTTEVAVPAAAAAAAASRPGYERFTAASTAAPSVELLAQMFAGSAAEAPCTRAGSSSAAASRAAAAMAIAFSCRWLPSPAPRERLVVLKYSYTPVLVWVSVL